MLTLFHFWSSMPAQRVRLALNYKGANFESVALDRNDDEAFFELGIAHSPLALRIDDGAIYTDSLFILEHLDGWIDGAPIYDGLIPADAWKALLDWRTSVDAILERLYAPVLPAFEDVGKHEQTLVAYKAGVVQRFGISVEALSNDRYAGYEQFAHRSHLPALAKHLAHNRFYIGGRLTAADLVLACDLFPLQLLDGVTLPLALMYYIERVEKACGASLREGLLYSM